VTSLGQQPLVIVSSPSKSYKTLGDLIAAAKANPGALNYSSAGIGFVVALRRRTAARQCRLRGTAHSVQGAARP